LRRTIKYIAEKLWIAECIHMMHASLNLKA